MIIPEAITRVDNVTVRQLDNGITVALEPLPHLRSVAAGVWIRAGSANETDEQAGVSHFLEHLFFKGTTTRTARQIVEAVEKHGGQINAFTSRDYTCLYVKTLDEHIHEGFAVLADILKDSQFFDLDKERNVVLEEIATAEDVPEDYTHDLFTGVMWPNHPLGRPVAGYQDTVSALNLDHVRAYYNARYVPGNIVIAAAGHFDEDALFEQARREFETLPGGTPPPDFAPAMLGAGSKTVGRDIAQSHVCFGFPAPCAGDLARVTYDVLNCALGGGSTSRLFERIREEEGLAYSIYSFQSCHYLGGVLGVYAAVAPENRDKVFDLCGEELRKFREAPMSEEELDLNREQLKGGLLMALENTFNRMSRMAKSILYHKRLIPVEEVVERIDAVTADMVHEVANGIFQRDRCASVVLGPENGARLCEPIL